MLGYCETKLVYTLRYLYMGFCDLYWPQPSATMGVARHVNCIVLCRRLLWLRGGCSEKK